MAEAQSAYLDFPTSDSGSVALASTVDHLTGSLTILNLRDLIAAESLGLMRVRNGCKKTNQIRLSLCSSVVVGAVVLMGLCLSGPLVEAQAPTKLANTNSKS